MLGAGLAFGWSGIATKLASDDLSSGHLVIAAAWGLATAAASAVGVLSETSSLQSRPAIQVAPVVFVTQTIVPVAVAPLLFGERFSDTPLGGVPLALSLALLVTGAAALVRSPAAARPDGRRADQPRQRLRPQPVPAERRRRSAPAPPPRPMIRRASRPALPRRARVAEAASPVALSRSAPLTGLAPVVRASTSWPTVSPPRGCRK